MDTLIPTDSNYELKLRPGAPRVAHLADLMGEWNAEAAAAHEAYRTGTARGPVTGLPKLDKALGGFLEPGLHMIHGNTGTGKTALALQIAASCGCPALFYSCEMRLLELVRRIAARVTKTFLGKMKTGELNPDEMRARFGLACQAAPLLSLVDATTTTSSPDWIGMKASEVRGDHRHLLIVVDSLHAWCDAAPDRVNEYESLTWAVESLRSMAAFLEAPILVLAEENRASAGRGGVNSGAGNRRIEYRSESVWGLLPTDDAKEDASGKLKVDVILEKNRNGAKARKAELHFNGALQQFQER